MAVRIRLKRMGRRNRPSYRVCVFDSRTRRDGRSIEDLGFYDTLSTATENAVKINVERARHWLSVGALPTEIVSQLFKRVGVTKTASPKSGAGVVAPVEAAEASA